MHAWAGQQAVHTTMTMTVTNRIDAVFDSHMVQDT